MFSNILKNNITVNNITNLLLRMLQNYNSLAFDIVYFINKNIFSSRATVLYDDVMRSFLRSYAFVASFDPIGQEKAEPYKREAEILFPKNKVSTYSFFYFFFYFVKICPSNSITISLKNVIQERMACTRLY